MTVNIVDDIMGSGKTTFAIQMMNEAPRKQKFIYITPFLSEVERITLSVSNRYFRAPDYIDGLKLEGLKRLIASGENIASTHSLFKRCDLEILELLRKLDYTLILDEVMEVIKDVPVVKKDMDTLVDMKYITILENGLVTWIEDPQYNGDFRKIKEYAVNTKLFFVHDKLFMSTFNVDLFNAFKEVYILTYLFNGQIQKAYFDLFNVQYRYKSIQNSGEQYYLIDYVKRSRSYLKPLINIEGGKINDIGKMFSLSATNLRTLKRKSNSKS